MKQSSMAGFAMSIALVLVALVATGCASIVKGSEQKVSFKSEPSEARVVITDVRAGKEIQVGSTPFNASLKRSAGLFKKAKEQVDFGKPGYQTEANNLEGTAGGWDLGGHLAVGGMGYLIVDP